MVTTRDRIVRRGLLVLSLAVAGIALSGCYDDYFGPRDTVTLGAGDAVAVNQATQTIDPWPPYARDTNLDVDGKRLGAAVTRYQQNKVIPPRGLSTTTVTEQSGPGAQVNTAIQK
jgi:hypothetical protein